MRIWYHGKLRYNIKINKKKDCAMNTAVSDEIVISKTKEWLEKAVIGLNLCPFAKAVYVKNQVRITVSHAKHLDAFLEDIDAEFEYLKECDPETTETSLLVHPTLFEDFFIFNDMLDLAEGIIEEHGLEGTWQIAPFHPLFQFEGTQVGDIENYTNRSPFPTLHFIREAGIEDAMKNFPDAATIFERNIKKLEALGHQGWQDLGLDDAELGQ